MADSDKLRIIAILEEIKKHESFFQNPLQNSTYKGFLIEYNLMENFIKKISFEELKNFSSINFSRLKEKLDFNKINNYIISKKFGSKQDLVNELKNGKKYYIILDTLWKKICKEENKNENGITFCFQDNKINLQFNNNESISFYINNGIIEQSNMVQTFVSRNNKRPSSCRYQKCNNRAPETNYNQKKRYVLRYSIDSNKQYRNEYSCLNCKLDIELKSIKYDKEKNEELVTFNCTGKCGTQIVSIKNFIDQCFNNTYLNEKCILCGKIQINEYLKNNNFIYCIYCKKVYCDDCKNKNNINFCPHNKPIYIYEIRKKCFIHGEQISYYCYDDKKLLCKECLNNEHFSHNKAYMGQSILSKDEYKLFGYILDYIKNLNTEGQKENEELFINDNNSELDSIQMKLITLDEREKSNCNDFILKKEKKKIKLEEDFNSNLKKISNDIIKELSSSIHKLEKEKIEIETLNNFFNNLEKFKNEYLKKISKIEKDYNSAIQYNSNICNTEIGCLKEGYANMRKSLKDSMDKELRRSIESKKTLIFDKNSEIGKMATLFLTCYNFNKTNYYMAKNLYNLISIFYRNKGIYNNVIEKKINEFENKQELLSIIEKKKFITFDNFISNTIRKDFYEPTFMGLKNIKSLPFMNPILQCFTQIEKFISYFKYSTNFKEIFEKKNKIDLSISFKYLIENLWPTNDKYTNNQNFHKNDKENYYSPYEIRDKLNKMNNSLNPGNRNSLKDLIIFIILTLHKELNRAKENVNDKFVQQFDDTNRGIMINNYMNNFTRQNMSIISDNFFSMKEIIIKCTNCQTTRYKFQTIFYFDFHLNQIFHQKKKINGNFMSDQNRFNTIVGNREFINESNVVNIKDCFAFMSNEKFQNMFCNNCKGFYPFSYNQKLSFAPIIMIIFINRLKRVDLEMKFEFDEYLDINQFIDFKTIGSSYKLIGVIVSLDEHGRDKRFIAFCRSPIDQKWYKYDDMEVTLVSDSNEEILKSNPSILLYEKINNN